MSENNVDLPVIEDFETDDLNSDPGLQDAIRRASLGQYDHTLFEMWEDILNEAKAQVSGNVTIMFANGLIRQWPWLTFKDIGHYFTARHNMLVEALESLEACFPKPAELLYQENEDDWALHKDAYIDVIVAWSQLANNWNDQWENLPLDHPLKGVRMAAVADMSALLVNPSTGLIENMSNLAGFDISEEETVELQKRVAGVDDD